MRHDIIDDRGNIVGCYEGNTILTTYGSPVGCYEITDKIILDNYRNIVGYYDYEGYIVDRDKNIVKRYNGDPVEAAATLLLNKI